MAERTEERPLRVGLVGAGYINFGGGDGPWNHSARIEQAENVLVVGIADPLQDKARAILEQKRRGPSGAVYRECGVYASLADLLQGARPDAVVIGTPAIARGALEAGRDLEIQALRAGVDVFVEKPLSVVEPEDFQKYCDAVMQAERETGRILSVGYMFRYHAAVERMRALIAAHGGKVMAVNARYYFSYSANNRNSLWWDAAASGAPIVEQATHFCDLARYLGGEVELGSVVGTSLRHTDPGGAGVLSGMGAGSTEARLPPEKWVPRVTSASWKFSQGGVGSLMHVIALHGKRYEGQVDVLLDGLRMTLYEPYSDNCTLLVRDAASEEQQTFDFSTSDPYKEEMEAFFAAVRSRDAGAIRSPYADAARTYALTWAIKRSTE